MSMKINENERNVLDTYFRNGNNKNFNVLSALSECESCLELKITLVYNAFCRFNSAVTNDENSLANTERLRKAYENCVKDICDYCDITDKKAAFALFAQSLYKVERVDKTNAKRIPYTLETVKLRALSLLCTLIFDTCETTLTAFETFILEQKKVAKNALQSVESEIRKLENGNKEFKETCALFKIPADNPVRVEKLRANSAKIAELKTEKEKAQKAYDDICAKTTEMWEAEFIKKYGENAL